MSSVADLMLVERESELAEISCAVEDAAGGAGRVLVVEGAAGLGKTRLLAEAATRAAGSGMLVLRARGDALETAFAFGVMRQLLERSLVELGQSRRKAVLTGTAGHAEWLLGRAAPCPRPAHTVNDVFSLVHAAYWLCSNLSEESPLALLVDDAHLSDPQSLLWLSYLARRVRDLPVLLVLSVRLHESGSSTAELGAIRAAETTCMVRPSPLSREGTRLLLGTTFAAEPDDRFADACHLASGGNPFLLHELAVGLVDDGVEPVDESIALVRRAQPHQVTQAVARRLTRLPDAASRLARAASVLGPEAELAHAEDLAGLDRPTAEVAMDALIAGGLVDGGRSIRFVHPLIRTAVYATTPFALRAGWHRRAASILAAGSAPVERVAGQLLEAAASADPWVVDRLVEAAAHARACGAASSVVAYLARALAEPPPAELKSTLLRDLGAAEVRTGAAGGIAHIREALEAAPDPRAQADVARELALALNTVGRTQEALAVLERAITAVEGIDREHALLLEGDLLGYAQLDLASLHRLPERLGGLQRPRAAETPGERVIAAYRAVAHVLAGGDLATAGRIAEVALGGGRLLAEQTADAATFYTAVHMLIDSERFELVDAALDQAIDDAHARGSVLGFAIASTQRSTAAYLRGALDTAEMEVRAALDAAREAGWAVGLPMTVSSLVDVLIERGRLREADEALEGAGMGGDVPELLAFDWLLWSRGRLRLAQGDHQRGLRDLLEAGARQARSGLRPVRTNWRTAAAPALAAIGDRERALALAEAEMCFAETTGTSRNRGMALRALGLTADGLHRVAHLHDAVGVLETSPARLEHARALVDLGAALRRSNRRSAAREQLVAGRSLAESCGAHALVDHARAELAVLGVRAGRQLATGAAALTPSELRVAQMAAQGMSNPAIAQALFVARKTIEKHLGAAYGKLGIASRVELPAALDCSIREDDR